MRLCPIAICILIITVCFQYVEGISTTKNVGITWSYEKLYNADVILNLSTNMMISQDIDNDGVSDKIFVSPQSRKVLIQYSSGNAVVLGENNGLEIPVWVCVGDVDADGFEELIVGSHNQSSVAAVPDGIKDRVLIYDLPVQQNSQPVYNVKIESFNEGRKAAAISSIIVGNFSGDGYDIAVSVYVDGDNGRIEIYDGPIYTGIIPAKLIKTSKGNKYIKLGDDNNDGLNDIYVLCSIDKKVEVYYKIQNVISDAPNKVYDTQNNPLCFEIYNNTSKFLAILSDTILKIYWNFNTPVDYNIGGKWMEVNDFNLDGQDEIGIIGFSNRIFSINYYDLNINLLARSYLGIPFSFFHYSDENIYLCGQYMTIGIHYKNIKNFVAMASWEFASIYDPLGMDIEYGEYYIWNSTTVSIVKKLSRETYSINVSNLLVINETSFGVLYNDTLFLINRNTGNLSSIFTGNNSSDIQSINYDNFNICISHINGNLTFINSSTLNTTVISSPAAYKISSISNYICGINSAHVWLLNTSSGNISSYPLKNMSIIRTAGIAGKYYVIVGNSTDIYFYHISEDSLLPEKHYQTYSIKDFEIGDFNDDGCKEIIILYPRKIAVILWENLTVWREYLCMINATYMDLGDLNSNGRLSVSILSKSPSLPSILQAWEFENLPPVAVINSPDIVIENTTVFLDGSGSYDQYSDIGNLNFTWYLLNNTTWMFLSHNKNATITFKTQGVYTIMLSVKDDEGLYSNSTKNITVLDSVPTVDFSFSPQNSTEGNLVHFYARCKSYDPIVNYSWKIENKIMYGESVDYKFVQNGTYEVTLTVIDSDGSVNSTSKFIFIKDSSPTLLGITYQPSNPVEGNTIVFNCSWSSYDTISSVFWEFGDGSIGEGTSVTHTYSKNGTYLIKVEIVDSDGSTANGSITINVLDSSPSVNIEGKSRAKEDDDVRFYVNITTVDPIISVEWDFNYSGNFTSEAKGFNTTHIFTESGMYTIAVKVVDSDGSEVITTKNIEIVNVPPQANFIITYQKGNIFRFDASPTEDTPSDLPLLNYTWDFGDGSIGYGKVVEHIYNDSGKYYVSLRVVDDDGSFSTYGIYVYVNITESGNVFPYLIPPAVLIPILLIILLAGRGKIEDIYLIHRNGLLLTHYSSKIKPATDEDTVSAMLIAILDFIKHTYKDEKEQLKSVELHGKNMLIDRLKSIFLVVVYRGRAGKMIRLKMRKTLEEIWEKYGDMLENWDGDMEKVRGIGDIVRKLWKI